MQADTGKLCVFWTGRESHVCLGDSDKPGCRHESCSPVLADSFQNPRPILPPPTAAALQPSSPGRNLTLPMSRWPAKGGAFRGFPSRFLCPGVTMPCERDSTEAPPPAPES
jgi:hypothetical protein